MPSVTITSASYTKLYSSNQTYTVFGNSSGSSYGAGLYNYGNHNIFTITSAANVYGVPVGFFDEEATGHNTVVNLGTLAGTAFGIAMDGANDVVSNTSTGIISNKLSAERGFGVQFGGVAGSGSGVLGTVWNAGRIVPIGSNIAAAIDATYGGVVTNVAGGTITGDTVFDELIGASTKTLETTGVGIVLNSGTMTGGGVVAKAAVDLYHGGTVTNLAGGHINPGSHTIAVYGGIAATTVTNAGSIGGSAGTLSIRLGANTGNRVVIDSGAQFGGKVDGGNAASSVLELASTASAGTLSGGLTSQYYNFQTFTVDSGANWTLAGANTIGAGVTLANAGTANITGALTNAGTVLLNSGSLTITTLSGAGVINFGASTGDILAFSSAASTVETINNMTIGQTIEIIGQTVTATDLLTGGTVIAAILSGGGTLDLKLGSSAGANFFHHTTVGGNTFITESATPCYLAGTRILTDRGDILVEDLRIGDWVITLDGTAKPIKWIGRRAYSSAFAAGNRDVIPILFKQGSLGEALPARDLYVSPLHAMFLQGVLVQAEHLVNGVSVLRCPEVDPIRYFHIELENHDVIFADGAPAETFVDCDSRGMFHNALEFADLYPDEHPQAWKFCFPRIESGPVLAGIRHGIDRRAGLADDAPGPLEGNLDGLDGATIAGWAFDSAHPDTPVVLEILDGDGLIARVTANRFRADLETAAVGDGRHGFELRLSRPLSAHTRHEIRVRRLTDGRELAGSPLAIEPYDHRTLVGQTRLAIDLAVETAQQTGALDGVLDTLLQGLDQVRRLRATQHAEPGDDRLLGPAKAHRQRARRALIVDTLLPRSGSDAVIADIEALQAQGWEVEFVASAELARSDGAAATLQVRGVTCHRAPLVASVEEVLRRKRDMFDLVCLRNDANADAYAALARVWQSRARLSFGVDEAFLAGRRAA